MWRQFAATFFRGRFPRWPLEGATTGRSPLGTSPDAATLRKVLPLLRETSSSPVGRPLFGGDTGTGKLFQKEMATPAPPTPAMATTRLTNHAIDDLLGPVACTPASLPVPRDVMPHRFVAMICNHRRGTSAKASSCAA